MSMLSSGELAQLRSDVLETLPDTAIIQEATHGYGPDGGTVTWSAVSGGTVVCRLDPVQRDISAETIASREVLGVVYRLTVPYDAPLAAGRRVQVGSNYYEIQHLDADHSFRIVRRAIVSEIR